MAVEFVFGIACEVQSIERIVNARGVEGARLGIERAKG